MARDVEIRHLEVERRARYAVLGSGAERPSATWFALHGYGQTAPRFLRYFASLDDGSRLLVAPEGLHRYYVDHEAGKVGASWMTSEDRRADIADYVAYLDRLHARIAGEGEVVALGFSQGVHTLARWMAFGSARIDAAVFWGSHLPPDLDLAEHAASFRAADVMLVAGDEDPHLDDQALAEAGGRLRSAGIPFETVRFPGDHRLDREVLERIAAERRGGG